MRRSTLPSLVLVATSALALAACASSPSDDASSQPTPTTSVDAGDPSAVTPVDDATLAAAQEEGEALLYTSADDQIMAPIAKAFEKATGIELRSLSLGDEEMFERYKTEVASGSPTADLVMNSDALGWRAFVESGNIEDYEDPNAPNLPDYAKLAPGVYAISEDPVIAVFNKALLPEADQPTTMAELAEQAEDLDGKIGTTDIGNAVQFGATTSYVNAFGDEAWEALETIGAHTTIEYSTGPLVTKLAQGQYAVAFFVSGSVRALLTPDVQQIVNYRYLQDGTPLLPRAVGVTAEAPNPNAAKVFLNWLLSVEGQEVACKTGFTPYREGVDCQFGLPAIEATVGEDNLIFGTFDDSVADERFDVIRRWDEAFGR